MKQQNTKISALISFALVIGGIIAANLFSDQVYKRFDLTKEKRFTLSETSKQLVQKLDDVIFFDIYLDGEFPKEYVRLRNATRDMLNEFRIASDGNIEFRFHNLLEDISDKDKDERNEILGKLSSQGVEITSPEIQPDEVVTTQRYIIPGGMVMYKNKEVPLNLLKRKFGNELYQDINNSIEQLEYEIGNAIRLSLAQKKTKIAIAEGHGELDPYDLADLTQSLEKYYLVDRLNLNIRDTACVKEFAREIAKDPENGGNILVQELSKLLNSYDGLIIAKPREEFVPMELLILDQYVMNGGKVMWLVETLEAEMDSLQTNPRYVTRDYQLGLDNLLFRYGVRVNPNLIQDLQCHGIPLIAGAQANRPVIWPWVYFPLFNSDLQHPISRNLDAVWGRFVSSIDTLPAQGVRKSILLESSDSSRVANNPVFLSLQSLAVKPNSAMFRQPDNIAGVLLEGQFTSPFAHRPAMKRRSPIVLKTKSEENRMIVISDGDIARNQANKDKGEVYPLGYDKYASNYAGREVLFANKKFLLNCIDYLCDDNNLIEVRSKKVEIRLLDKARVKAERVKWQMINLIVPVVLIIILGLIYVAVRRAKYVR